MITLSGRREGMILESRSTSTTESTVSTVDRPVNPAGGAKVPLSLIGRLTIDCVRLALVLFVIYEYQLESRTFFNVMALAFAGFAIHALLPLRYRPIFFVGLSFAAIFVAFGWLDGIFLIALGLLLIGICHLPLRMTLRVLLLAVTATVFALWRLEILPGPWSVAIWPILGSMFMFRIALYLHALKHDEKAPTAATTLSYFFMLPNVCYPLFPVVDYMTFRRNYYDREAFEIYETGIGWIVRGLVHLILYRIVYLNLAADPTDLNSLGELVGFLLGTFLLYLRISGQFHVITGVLHLFGFRLPETHHLYFLSSSFTDFWRRINIYWKDFMMKLVYYPSFFRLKSQGSNVALIGATVVVFFGTWILHSYQWFWLRGSFPIEPQDGLFWGTLGALVVMGALKEMRRSRPRTLGKSAPWSLSLGLRTVRTFIVICVLWSLWSAESVVEWLLMWVAAGNTTPIELLIISAMLLTGIAVAGKDWSSEQKKSAATASAYYGLAAPATLTLVVLLALGWKDVYAPIAPSMAAAVASVQRSTLNAADAALQHKGYYEKLDNSSRLTAQLWETTAGKPQSWIPLVDTPAYQPRQDFVWGELKPNADIVFSDQPLKTNTWGMRDRERALDKPAGVYRIAMVGPSHVMGSGVSNENTISRLLERLLNQSADKNPRFEVLNFGVAGYALTQQLAILEEKVFRFHPDAILFVTEAKPQVPIIGHLLHNAATRRRIPFAGLQELVEETGVNKLGSEGFPMLFDIGRSAFDLFGIQTRMPWAEAEQRVRRSADRFVKVALEHMASLSRENGALPVFVALDIVLDPPVASPPAVRDAKSAGMLVFDMLDVWRGRDYAALRVGSWDNHPNAAGNRVAAERLYQLIIEHAGELRVDKNSVNTQRSLSGTDR